MGFFGIPNPKNTKKNPDREIPGIGIWILKSRENSEWEIPKIRKSPGSGFIFSDLFLKKKKYLTMPLEIKNKVRNMEKINVKNTALTKLPWIHI